MLALLLILAPLFPQEVLTETLPDGGVVEREVVRDADGNPVDHGSYEVRHANGEQAVRGRMKDGLRHGKWRFFHPTGKKQATGWYRTGLREKEWTYWDEDGEVDEAESGEYELVELPYSKKALRSRGEARNGERHGTWTFYWEEGTVKATGSYQNGRLEGGWRFHHPDGTFDPTWISGVYRGGRRAADLAGAGEAPPPAGRGNDSGAERLTALRSADDQRAIERETLALLEVADADLQLAVDLLLELDPAVERESALARRLREQVLVPAFGAAFDVLPERRWSTLFRLAEADAGLRYLTLPDRLEELGAGATLDQVHPALSDGSLAEVLGPYREHLLADRLRVLFPRRDLVAERGGKGTQQAVEDALTWLRNHQAPDGSWDTDGIGKACEARGAEPCSSESDWIHDAGMTGLALLAFLGAGNTPHHGPHADVVARGVRWLITKQDVKTGLLGERLGHAYVYNHAIATMALCEAAGFSESALLRDTAQRAVDYCSRARNPFSAWRYDVPPSGDNDTSVTAWMVQTLRTAEAAGLDVDESGFEGALNWIDEVTDPAVGRCGYDKLGSPSSRVELVNDHYPPTGEAMTAAALYCRFVIGQDPTEERVFRKHADLLLAQLPEWDPEGYGCDMYYWYYGTHAMMQMGGKDWQRWNAALKQAALGSQVQSGDAKGSWDPIGPWGYAGGRIYSTAMMALCLESYYRYPRVVEPR